ncbi:MAG: tyrosine--tRNA ligase [Candidatus Dormibacteraeota bacterium]|nr:tyrosine--tRNA ligase [Candidatus Dormibacteraeota bacterium]
MSDWEKAVRGAVNVEIEDHLRQQLESGRELRVKLGIDPSSPDIHLGHTVVLGKLRDFQDLGHQAVLIIGDFTARIGDPSGQSVTRRSLTEEEVETNAATYLEQVFKVLDRDLTEVRRQSEWYGDLDLAGVLRLASKATLAQITTRDDFRRRIDAGRPVGLHELMYPLMQGYDSVAVRSDVELGGTDQLFNLMLGRDLQRESGQPPQDVVTMPLLEGLDGVRKMSKSLDNYVGVTDPPAEMFGKLMSVPDELITRYMRLAAGIPEEEVLGHQQAMDGGGNPRDAKVALALALVTRFHGASDADEARSAFASQFKRGVAPQAMAEFPLSQFEDRGSVAAALAQAGLAKSLSDARRLISQGGVKVDGTPVTDVNYKFDATPGAVLQVGKRHFARVVEG